MNNENNGKDFQLGLVNESILATVSNCGLPVIITGADDKARNFVSNRLIDFNNSLRIVSEVSLLRALISNNSTELDSLTEKLVVEVDKPSPVVDKHIGSHVRLKVFLNEEQISIHFIPVIKKDVTKFKLELSKSCPTALVCGVKGDDTIDYTVFDSNKHTEIKVNSNDELISAIKILDGRLQQIIMAGARKYTSEMGFVVFLIDLDNIDLNEKVENNLNHISRMCRSAGVYVLAKTSAEYPNLSNKCQDVFVGVFYDSMGVKDKNNSDEC